MNLGKGTPIVAILVIMEDVFLRVFLLQQNRLSLCRNPCYNGRCISTGKGASNNRKNRVAILVIMEDVFLPMML